MASDFTTPRQALAWATARLEAIRIDHASDEASALISHLYGRTGMDKPLDSDEISRGTGLIERRVAGEPLAYVIGHARFRSLTLLVDRRVLVPRPATEALVELAIEELGERRAASVADVCTGSGTIALSLAVERPELRIVATDISADALVVARANLERLQAVGRARTVELRAGDLLAPLGTERFEVIATNPPYIPTADMAGLAREVLHEPNGALESGADGLDAIRRLVAGGRENLVPGGLLAIEHGVGQDAAVGALLRAAGYSDVRSTLDLGNVLRVTSGRS